MRGSDPDDPRERAGRAGDVTGEPDHVPDHYPAVPELACAHRGDGQVADEAAVPAAVDGGDESPRRRPHGRAAAGSAAASPCPAGPAHRPRPGRRSRFACSGRALQHRGPGAGESGERLADGCGVAAPAGRGTASPSTAAAITSRWSSWLAKTVPPARSGRGPDRQAVRQLGDVPAERADLPGQRGQPVAFLGRAGDRCR